MHKKLGYLLMALAFVVVLAACGSKNDSDSGAAPSESLVAEHEIIIKASSWDFDQEEYVIPKDTPVKITVENVSGAHGIQIKGPGTKIRGGKSEIVTLAAGTYEFFCNIQCGTGHNQMVGKIVVQ